MTIDLDPGHHYDNLSDAVHPHLPHCARCGAALVDNDGRDTDGRYFCDDFHGHDEDGVFAPIHAFTRQGAEAEDDEFSIVCDGTDRCR